MKKYNISQLAKELGIARQTLYYWIEKEWAKPNRDYRKYPVFMEKDARKIKEWRDRLAE